jgi:hypothetical protein
MNRRIPIYKAERDAGIADVLRTTATVAYASELQISDIKLAQAKADKLKTAIATNEGQIDLHYLKSILATVGWNNNDDVFGKKETWVARATPEDKPFNIEHQPRQIRGHITGNYIIDYKGNTLDDNLTVDELPDNFHVVTSSVLYKFINCEDKELVQEMEKIIAEITEHKWFISMEALFDDFDYAIIDKDGANKVIARSDDSAFLTKHLRAYGGTGQYDGRKIGRLLKNIIFSGKGLVRRPANPNSIIFDNVAAFHKVVASSVKEFTTVGYTFNDTHNSTEESNRMAAEVTQIDLLQNENKRLEQTLNAAVAAQKEAEKRLTEMNEQTVKAKIDGLANDVKVRDEKIQSLTNQIQTEQKARTEAEAKVVELEKKYTELQGEITKVQAETKKNARIAVISAELGKKPEEAVQFYDEQVADLSMSDERFTKFIATLKAEKGVTTATSKTNATVTDPLGKAEPTGKTAPLGTEGVSTDVEKTRAGLASFLGQQLRRGAGVKNKKNEGE